MQKRDRFIEVEGVRLLVNTPEEIAAAEEFLWEVGAEIARVQIAFDGDFDDVLSTPDVIASAFYKSPVYTMALASDRCACC